MINQDNEETKSPDIGDFYVRPFRLYSRIGHVMDAKSNFAFQFEPQYDDKGKRLNLDQDIMNKILLSLNSLDVNPLDNFELELKEGIHLYKDNKLFITIRGWGNLTGTGAWNFSQDKAAAIQDNLVKYIIAKTCKGSISYLKQREDSEEDEYISKTPKDIYEYAFIQNENIIVKEVYELSQIPHIKTLSRYWGILPLLYCRQGTKAKTRKGEIMFIGDIISHWGMMRVIEKDPQGKINLRIVYHKDKTGFAQTHEQFEPMGLSNYTILGNMYENPEILNTVRDE